MLGKLRQQPGLEQGICFPAECMEEGSHFPTQALLYPGVHRSPPKTPITDHLVAGDVWQGVAGPHWSQRLSWSGPSQDQVGHCGQGLVRCPAVCLQPHYAPRLEVSLPGSSLALSPCWKKWLRPGQPPGTPLLGGSHWSWILQWPACPAAPTLPSPPGQRKRPGEVLWVQGMRGKSRGTLSLPIEINHWAGHSSMQESQHQPLGVTIWEEEQGGAGVPILVCEVYPQLKKRGSTRQEGHKASFSSPPSP